MERLIPEIVNGIVLGAFYAIIAIGLSLIMNLTGTVNLAHGSFLTLAGYLAFTLLQRGTNFWLALGISAILTVIIGLVVERTLIQPLYKRIPLYSLLLTFGLALIAEEVFRLIWGPQSVPFSTPASLQGATDHRRHRSADVPFGHYGRACTRHAAAVVLHVSHASRFAAARCRAQPRDDGGPGHQHASALHDEFRLSASSWRRSQECWLPG